MKTGKVLTFLFILLISMTFPFRATAALPEVEITPDPLEFPDTRVGEIAGDQVLTISNLDSWRPAYIFILYISNSRNFHITHDGCSDTIVSAGDSCRVDLTFEPDADGQFSTSFSVIDTSQNILDTSTVKGRGIAPDVVLSVTSIDFGHETVDTVSAVHNVILINDGNDTLDITGIEADGEFSVTDDCGSRVESKTSCTIGVTFDPPTTGDFTGTVTITDDAPDSPQTISLSGTGVSAENPDIHLSRHLIDFGGQAIGTTSDAETVTVTNSGTADLAITGIVASENFGQTNDCPATLSTGGQCTISATFTPSATESFSGTIIITDNASDSPQTIELLGHGLQSGAFQANLSATSLDFENVTLGETSDPQTISARNIGTTELTIQDVSIIGDDQHGYSETNDCLGTALVGGASCTISTTFSPALAGAYSANLTITDSADEAAQAVALSGTGVESTSGGGCAIITNSPSKPHSWLIFAFAVPVVIGIIYCGKKRSKKRIWMPY